jgi:hypothetical protein
MMMIIIIICAAIEEVEVNFTLTSEIKPNVHVICFSFILINIFAHTHTRDVKLQYCILEHGNRL